MSASKRLSSCRCRGTSPKWPLHLGPWRRRRVASRPACRICHRSSQWKRRHPQPNQTPSAGGAFGALCRYCAWYLPHRMAFFGVSGARFFRVARRRRSDVRRVVNACSSWMNRCEPRRTRTGVDGTCVSEAAASASAGLSLRPDLLEFCCRGDRGARCLSGYVVGAASHRKVSPVGSDRLGSGSPEEGFCRTPRSPTETRRRRRGKGRVSRWE